ncbi:MAG: type II CRISPR-associated endonuclease Cas1 [Gordonibacter sp.]|uniref:type II CRISPR-associated endonuclease Cas1 n=1 Tax=Gordonibacter sp. TaxID=1968902 RepID=UPI002FC9A772
MADNWRILDFTTFHGELRFVTKSSRLQSIASATGEITEHSLSDVNIIFVGIYVTLAPAVMYHCAKKDVVVLFCDWKGLPACSLYPWIDAHGRVAARQRAQAALSAPRSKNAWMRIVKAKVKGQAETLKYLNRPSASKLFELAGKVRSGDPTNVEAHAARTYWSVLFGDECFSRDPGAKDMGRNSLLDYGYTILRGHSMRAVLSAGLTPALGLYHKGRSNLFALADDLIEPFRPVVDLAVARLGADATVESREVKRILLQSTLVAFANDGLTVPSVMTDLAQQFGKYVEGEVEHFVVPIWDPKFSGEETQDEYGEV